MIPSRPFLTNHSVALLLQQAVHPKITPAIFLLPNYLNTALNWSLITVTAKILCTVLSTALHKYLTTPLMSLSFSLITVCREMEAIIGCPHYGCPSKKRTEGTMMVEVVDKGLRHRQASLSHIFPHTPLHLLWLYDSCNSASLIQFPSSCLWC